MAALDIARFEGSPRVPVDLVVRATSPYADVKARARCVARASEANDDDDGIQLGTAKLPPTCDETALCDALYQWASTLTSSGQNLPFALSQRVDRTNDGFELAFLTAAKNGAPGELAAVGAIAASVEVAGQEKVLMIRGYGNVMNLVDTPVVMGAMPAAIRRAVAMSSA